jgi:DNA replication and repair protein RecF
MLDEYVSVEGASTLSPYPLRIKLKAGGMPEDEENCMETIHILRDKFMERLEFYSERETKAKIPFVGPHRDDILISIRNCKGNNFNESLPADVLSRGQKRRAVLSIILASGRILERKLKRKPLFLLDEVFSELDEEARQIVADALFNTGWQIFAASAENTISNWQGEIYNLKDGEIV